MTAFDLRRFLRDRSRGLVEKTRDLHQRIEDARARGEYLHFRTVCSPAEAEVVSRDLDGQGEASRLQLASNNYLGLATHPRVVAAAREAVDAWGVGAGGPCTIQGWTPPLQALEAELAAFKGCEAAVVSPSGYAANVGTLTSLLGPDDVILCDELDHASILDGARFSGAQLRVFRHSDVDDLARSLEDLRDHPGTKLVVVCGVYSMDGDLAPLGAIVPVVREHGALLMVDDAHATGVVGATGKGTTEAEGVHGQVDLVMGTFSKALGCYGGFVAGPAHLVTFLRHLARATMFSAAPSPATIAAVREGLRVIADEPQLRQRLHENVAYVRGALTEAGFDVGASASAITPVMIRDEGRCHALVSDAYQAGLFLSMIQYPAVARGSERIRLTCMATHSRDQLEGAVSTLVELGRKHGVI